MGLIDVGMYYRICRAMKKAIERIVTMIKEEMPDYLVSSEELNRLAADSWFNMEHIGA